MEDKDMGEFEITVTYSHSDRCIYKGCLMEFAPGPNQNQISMGNVPIHGEMGWIKVTQ